MTGSLFDAMGLTVVLEDGQLCGLVQQFKFPGFWLL